MLPLLPVVAETVEPKLTRAFDLVQRAARGQTANFRHTSCSSSTSPLA
jgi:hypothetical protein